MLFLESLIVPMSHTLDLEIHAIEQLGYNQESLKILRNKKIVGFYQTVTIRPYCTYLIMNAFDNECVESAVSTFDVSDII